MSDTQPTNPAPVPPRKRTLLHRLFEWSLILTLVATVGGWLGDLWWIFDLCNHFRVQYAMFLGLFAIGSLIYRKWSFTAFACLGAVLNYVMIAPLFTDAVPRPVAMKRLPPLSVVAFNVHTANRRFIDVARFISDNDADIILLQEIDRAWDEALRTHLGSHYMALSVPREDNFGMAIVLRGRADDPVPRQSQLVVESLREVDISGGIAEVPTFELIGSWQDRRFALLGIHTLPPVRASIAHIRDTQLHGAALWAIRHQKAGLPVIIVGDLNATPWCVPFRRLVEDANLIDTTVGRGMAGSWFSGVPWFLRIPIDHALHSRDLRTYSRRVLDDALGSDHLPVQVKIDWKDDRHAVYDLSGD